MQPCLRWFILFELHPLTPNVTISTVLLPPFLVHPFAARSRYGFDIGGRQNDLVGIALVNGQEPMVLIERKRSTLSNTAPSSPTNGAIRGSLYRWNRTQGNMLLKYEWPSLLEKL
jgi:hypothetical protein